MKVLIFNGSPEKQPHSVGNTLTGFFTAVLQKKGVDVVTYAITEAEIPLLDLTTTNVPPVVKQMCEIFTQADAHIWLTPLYHGSMTGVMKNCLDWLELTSKWTVPYLTDKKIGLVCWADGMQAMQGINTMDAVAKSLRAWTLPYAIPIARSHLYEEEYTLSAEYTTKFERMITLLIK